MKTKIGYGANRCTVETFDGSDRLLTVFLDGPHAAEQIGVLQQQVIELHREVARLEAIVAKLPRTADGVPVVPGDDTWSIQYGECVRRSVTFCSGRFYSHDQTGAAVIEWLPVSSVYSTQAAAEAARKGKGL